MLSVYSREIEAQWRARWAAKGNSAASCHGRVASPGTCLLKGRWSTLAQMPRATAFSYLG